MTGKVQLPLRPNDEEPISVNQYQYKRIMKIREKRALGLMGPIAKVAKEVLVIRNINISLGTFMLQKEKEQKKGNLFQKNQKSLRRKKFLMNQ